MRLILDFSLMRHQEQAATGVQYFVPPSLVPLIQPCANVVAPKHARVLFAISLMRYLERSQSEAQHFVPRPLIIMVELCANVRALDPATNL